MNYPIIIEMLKQFQISIEQDVNDLKRKLLTGLVWNKEYCPPLIAKGNKRIEEVDEAIEFLKTEIVRKGEIITE